MVFGMGQHIAGGMIMGWNRLRTYALVAAVALLSTLVVVVPAFGDDHLTDVDAVEFTAVDGVPRFEYGELAAQVLGFERNSCAIADPAGESTDTILNLTSTGGVPGLNGDSIGVRANGKNANGTPCSQIDSTESLTITPGNQLPGAMFSAVRLDLEMTGDATVVVSFADGADSVGTFVLYTGKAATEACAADPALEGCNGTSPTSGPYHVASGAEDPFAACASASSSGPNSHANDNCIWAIDPGDDFDEITITVQDVGTASLEGGSDTGADNTSLFYLAPDRLNCDEDVTFEGTGEPTYTVRPENGGADCVKDYTYEAGLRGDGEDEQFVELATSGTEQVVFLEKVEFLPFDGSSQISQQLYYDDTLLSQDNPKLAQFCLLDPRVGAGTDNPAFDLHDDYDSAAEAGDVLPTGETTCIINADFLTTGSDGGSSLVTPVYYLFNLNDGFRTFK
jgi:hypothetical protein